MAQFNIAWASLVIVRHGRLPDMDDATIYLEAVAHHLPRHKETATILLGDWAARLGVELDGRAGRWRAAGAVGQFLVNPARTRSH
jgi:hypothetical protein